MCASTYTYTHA
jgi:hypothetical protein